MNQLRELRVRLVALGTGAASTRVARHSLARRSRGRACGAGAGENAGYLDLLGLSCLMLTPHSAGGQPRGCSQTHPLRGPHRRAAGRAGGIPGRDVGTPKPRRPHPIRPAGSGSSEATPDSPLGGGRRHGVRGCGAGAGSRGHPRRNGAAPRLRCSTGGQDSLSIPIHTPTLRPSTTYLNRPPLRHLHVDVRRHRVLRRKLCRARPALHHGMITYC